MDLTSFLLGMVITAISETMFMIWALTKAYAMGVRDERKGKLIAEVE